MIPPIEVRQAAGRYAGNNTAIAAAFVQGWLFAHPEYKNEAPAEPLSMEGVINKWLEYKKEKRLLLKFSKFNLFPVSRGIDFLGYRHFPGGYVLLRKTTAKRVKKRMKSLLRWIYHMF